MASISPTELAAGLLDDCLAGRPWLEESLEGLIRLALDPDEVIARLASRALFGTLVEGLADRFEPRLCDVYADLFSRVLARALPELDAAALAARYAQVRRVRPVAGDPTTVFVLSRVTLGADIAVTSIILDACRRRFPAADIVLVGSKKAHELFVAEPRIRHLEMPYGRTATLAGRLSIWPEIREQLSRPDAIVLDPDSRLTQSGLLPVCEPERHYLFESRSYGGDGGESLPVLTARWVKETLEVEDAIPWLSPRLRPDFGGRRLITCSFGVGENPNKRLPDPFEPGLLRLLAARGAQVIVDLGAGGEEAERVQRAIRSSGVEEGRIGIHQGPFASFASLIAQSELYAGYDSAGQHVAAALGVPLLCIFAGAVCPRMIQRWAPDGPGPRHLLRVENEGADEVLSRVAQVLC